MMKSILALPIALVAFAASAEPQLTVQLQALTNSPGYQNNLARLFAQLPPDTFQRCSALVSNGSTVTVVEPVAFSTNGFPVSGLWKQSFPVSGCGNDTTINFYFRGQADGKIVSVIGLPGETHADLTLQRDAMAQVALATGVGVKGCANANVRTTSYEGPLQGANVLPSRPAWHETWTVSACGQILRLPINFIPDATGTTVRIRMK